MKRTLLSAAIAALPFLSLAQGTIVQDTIVLHLTTLQMDSLLASQGLPTGVLPLEYEVDVHRVVYDTPHPNGTDTYASGLVFVPTGVACALPTVTYLHGTKVKKDDTFYYLGGEWFLGAVMASSGYLSALPDYIGLGFSPGLHPYQHARSEATASIDLLRAARTICADSDVALNGQLFITGYSQGGHAVMATHRMIQEELSDEFTVTASAPGSGPYDMSGSQLDMVAAWASYSQPGYLPYLILSYQSVYGNLYDDITDVFTPPYDQTLPPLLNGDYHMGELNEAMPDTPRLIIVPEYAEAFFNDPQHPAFLALQDNDVYDWVPEAPVLFNYCSSDEEVTYLNTIVTVEHMNGLGATDITAIERSTTLGHFECANPSLLFSKYWFDDMVEWCEETGIAEEAALSSMVLYPNPVTGGVLHFSNTTPLDVSVHDLTGRELLRQHITTVNGQIELTAASSGMYLVTVRSGELQKTERIILP